MKSEGSMTTGGDDLVAALWEERVVAWDGTCTDDGHPLVRLNLERAIEHRALAAYLRYLYRLSRLLSCTKSLTLSVSFRDASQLDMLHASLRSIQAPEAKVVERVILAGDEAFVAKAHAMLQPLKISVHCITTSQDDSLNTTLSFEQLTSLVDLLSQNDDESSGNNQWREARDETTLSAFALALQTEERALRRRRAAVDKLLMSSESMHKCCQQHWVVNEEARRKEVLGNRRLVQWRRGAISLDASLQESAERVKVLEAKLERELGASGTVDMITEDHFHQLSLLYERQRSLYCSRRNDYSRLNATTTSADERLLASLETARAQFDVAFTTAERRFEFAHELDSFVDDRGRQQADDNLADKAKRLFAGDALAGVEARLDDARCLIVDDGDVGEIAEKSAFEFDRTVATNQRRCSSTASCSALFLSTAAASASDEPTNESHSKPTALYQRRLSLRTPSSNAHLWTQKPPMMPTKADLIADELLKTERDYVHALGFVVDTYMPLLSGCAHSSDDDERPPVVSVDIPQALRGQCHVVFGNLEKIYALHRHSFLRALTRCCSARGKNGGVPNIGACFLLFESDFELYSLYSKNKPKSDALMLTAGRDFFRHTQQHVGDLMDLQSYLLKPIQRLAKYQLLLQQLVNNADDSSDLRRALHMIRFQLRHGNDLLAADRLRLCDVNLSEQGRLLRQADMQVQLGGRRSRKHRRRVFLFEQLLVFAKQSRVDDDFVAQ